MTESTTTCAVVGGGPAGLVAGLLLARAGVDVTVIEKHADFLRDFRGDTVHASTLELLDQLGLFERFDALPHSRIEEARMPLADDGTIKVADMRHLAVAHPYVAMVPQWHFLNLLADAAAEEPAFHLLREAEVTDVIRDGEGVAGVVYRTRDGRQHRLRADLTIAADGRRSAVRRAAGLRVRSFEVALDAWWFRVPTERSIGDSLLPRGVGGHVFGVVPREGYAQIAQIIEKGSDARLRALGVDAFHAGVAQAVPDLADAVETVGLDDVKLLDIEQNRLERWYRPGLLCIGDAAHAMSPIGGVGVNLAIQDAVAAAARVAGPLREGCVAVAALRSVQRRRTAPTRVTQWLQRRMHSMLHRVIVDEGDLVVPRAIASLLRLVPALPNLVGRVVAVGVRSESAPDFARRAGAQGG